MSNSSNSNQPVVIDLSFSPPSSPQNRPKRREPPSNEPIVIDDDPSECPHPSQDKAAVAKEGRPREKAGSGKRVRFSEPIAVSKTIPEEPVQSAQGDEASGSRAEIVQGVRVEPEAGSRAKSVQGVEAVGSGGKPSESAQGVKAAGVSKPPESAQGPGIPSTDDLSHEKELMLWKEFVHRKTRGMGRISDCQLSDMIGKSMEFVEDWMRARQDEANAEKPPAKVYNTPDLGEAKLDAIWEAYDRIRASGTLPPTYRELATTIGVPEDQLTNWMEERRQEEDTPSTLQLAMLLAQKVNILPIGPFLKELNQVRFGAEFGYELYFSWMGQNGLDLGYAPDEEAGPRSKKAMEFSEAQRKCMQKEFECRRANTFSRAEIAERNKAIVLELNTPEMEGREVDSSAVTRWMSRRKGQRD